MEFKEAGKSGQDNPQSYFITLADKLCDITILGQTLTSDVGDSGSRALGEVHEDVLRSRLQDVPKIAQLVEARLHRWFDERAVEPRFQEIALPSLWPRKKNTRGPDDAMADVGSGSVGRSRGKDLGRDTRDGTRLREPDSAEEASDMTPPVRHRRPQGPREDDDFPMPGSLPGIQLR